jgi:hypothetical protein
MIHVEVSQQLWILRSSLKQSVARAWLLIHDIMMPLSVLTRKARLVFLRTYPCQPPIPFSMTHLT